MGVGIRAEGKHWKVSGAMSVTNDSGAETEKTWQHDSFARRAEGEFVYHHNLKTWCPDGYDEERGPTALHMEEIVGKTWTGGLQYGSRDISGNDTGTAYDKARSEGRVMTFHKGDTFTKTKGKTFKYTAEVSAFGVGLNAESVNDVKHTMVVVAGHSREQWHLFGDVTVPADAPNHAVYIYF